MTRRVTLAALALLSLTAAAQAKLELFNIKAVQGQFGPERASLDVLSGDEVYFRFQVKGIKVDGEGRVHGTVAVTLSSEGGEKLVENKTPLQGVLALGGDSLPGRASVRFTEQIKPGVYRLKVTVTDGLTKESDSFERKLTCKPAEFAVVMPRFYYDANDQAPASVGGATGQVLYFRLQVVGFDKSKGKIDQEMNVHVLDDKGKELMPKPITARLQSADAGAIKNATTLNFSGNFVLTRPGEFMLKISITDRLSENKKATFEAPLTVREP